MNALPFTRVVTLSAITAVLSLRPASATETPPPVGTVRSVPVVSVSLAVGSTEKQTKRTVYAPPPGWYVRSHRVVTTHRKGIASYSVGTVPAGWNWKVDERAAESRNANASAVIAAAHAQTVSGQAATSGASASLGRSAQTSSHHVLVVDVSAEGEGLLIGGSAVELTVVAEMVYLGK